MFLTRKFRVFTVLFVKCNHLRSYSVVNMPKKFNGGVVNLSYMSFENTESQNLHEESTPNLVIMHGLMGSKNNWNSICKALFAKTKPNRRIISVDARNHGDSPHSENHSYEHLAEDVVALFKKLHIKKSAILGHSMGGRAMMYLALKYPDLVEKLVVVDISPVRTSPSLITMPSYFRAMQQVQIDENLPSSAARKQADFQMSSIIKDSNLRQFLITNLVKQDNKYTWKINLSALQQNFVSHIVTFPNMTGSKYTGPTFFIGGGASDYIKMDDHPDIRKMFPSAEFQYIPQAGHWVHSEKPNEFIQLVVEFLNRPS